jgi:16S rRNA (uracil1498-N3)-methyltransferase
VAFALTKGCKPEIVVQKLTELGIDRIVPFTADRSIAQWEGTRGAKQIERLRRISRAAAMQSRRVWVPVVDELATYVTVAAFDGAVRAERGRMPIAAANKTVLIGPEGGWSDLERETLGEVGLSDHVLRAETAAVAAATLLVTQRTRSLTDR